MSTRKGGAASAAPEINPEAYYVVQLNRPVPAGRRDLIPVHIHRIKGSFLATLPEDAIVSAVEFVPPAADQVGG